MQTRFIRSLSLLMIVAGPAAAQAPDERGGFESSPPSMHTAASKTVKVAPDELVADLTALGSAPSAVTAQHQVNSVVAKAKALADQANGIKVTFQGYSVTFIDEKPTHWVAQQTVEVRGGDGEKSIRMSGVPVTAEAIGDKLAG